MSTVQQGKSYVFSVVVEPDEDVWRAYVPELEARGVATWGKTKDEALRNLQEVAQMVVEGLVEDGELITNSVATFDRPVVAISV